MKRPESVKIIGQTFAIVYEHMDEPSKSVLADKHSVGGVSVPYQRIGIDTAQGEDQIRDTLLHELLHACRLIVNRNDDEDDEEERRVRAMSPVLLDVLRSNPDVTAFLVEGA